MMIINKLTIDKKSDTVFIIGGGSSLKKYLPDSNILNGKDIICCNNAYQKFPNSIVCLFADKAWFELHNSFQKFNDYSGYKIICTNFAREDFYNKKNIHHIYPRGASHGLNEDKDFLNGSNTGHMAINLAFHMGYKNIILLGFDMDSSVTNTHWHNDHLWKINTQRYDESFLPNMDTIKPFEKKYDFKIFNINKESKIKCFEFTELEKWL